MTKETQLLLLNEMRHRTDRTESDTIGPDRTESDRSDSDYQNEGLRFKGNLTAAIEEYIENITGSFTVADIDRELRLVLRQDKKRRSDALRKIEKEKKIYRDQRTAGRWHVNRAELQFVDLEAAQEQPFKLRLPLDLDGQVSIPPKAIIILAGSSNSGKTCLALNLLRMNMDEGVPLLYLMSEMGPTEYGQRVSLFGDPLPAWNRNIKAASCSVNFHGAIAQHNPDGITVVDFLEEFEGEYYKIPSSIRSIYDALGTGVAIICLQKKAGALFGRGGESTQEKARLYLTLDNLLHQPRHTICSLRIQKAKSYSGSNPNGKERHFKIIRGHQIMPMTDWMYCNDRQRAAYVTQYQNQGRMG